MKKVASITCLLVISLGAVAAWAGMCCPEDHEMVMQAMDDCLTPFGRTVRTAAAVDEPGKTGPLLIGSTLRATEPAPAAQARGLHPLGLPPGGASPAASQATSVLLR